MTTNFLPDYSVMPIAGGQVIGLYRLFEDSQWRQVCHPKTKKAIPFPSAKEAIAAAKEVVKLKLNPPLHSVSALDPVPVEDPTDADILALESWRQQKQEEYAKTRAMVKNGKNRRKFVVEKRERKKCKQA